MLTYSSPRTSTTEMEVTSIRLERSLKDKLKALAGDQGYQALVRQVLWNYVEQNSDQGRIRCSRDDLRASIPATALREEKCALTGDPIYPGQSMALGFTAQGQLVPLCSGNL